MALAIKVGYLLIALTKYAEVSVIESKCRDYAGVAQTCDRSAANSCYELSDGDDWVSQSQLVILNNS